MGNTIATPSNDKRKPSSTRSLRKMTSSSTLPSLKMYRQQNRSDTSLSSKISTRSYKQPAQFAEKILDISKPTKFEHGIHVEYDRDSGKYMVHFFKMREKRETYILYRVYPMFGNQTYQVMMLWILIMLLLILSRHLLNQNVSTKKKKIRGTKEFTFYLFSLR